MSSRDPIPTIRQRLRGARIELALVGIVRRVAAALWEWLLVAAGVIFIDAMWPTAPLVRLVVAVALALGLIRILWRCIPPRSLRRASPGRLAREIEQRCNLQHNPLITAMQLRVAPSVAGPADVNALLRDRTARRGEQAALATESAPVADSGSRRHARLALLGAITFAVAAGLVAPRPIAAVARRVVDPFGDHPPYTPLTFDVSFEPESRGIVYGENAKVIVRIGDYRSDRSVDHADLVTRFADGATTPSRIPLQPEPFDSSVDQTHAFTATLRDLREPMRVMVDTPRGRSEWISIEPRRMPRWVARTATITGPAYAASQQPRRLPLADRTEPIRVLQGSRVSVSATSTLPLTGMLATGVESPNATLSDDHLAATWNWSADAVGSHDIDLTLVGPTGLRSTSTLLRIDVQPDAPPATSIRQPSSDAAALPDQKFRAAVEALDDVSVGDMTVTARVERKGAIVDQAELPIAAMNATGDRAAATVDVDLSQFDLRPGDTVQLRAAASDQRPDALGGPQTSELAQSNILIIDEKTYAALASQRAGGGQPDPQESSDPSAGSGSDDSQNGQSGGDPSRAGASGRAPGESGVPLASGDDSGQSTDGSQQGGTNASSTSGDPNGRGTAPAPNGASAAAPGGDGQSTTGSPGQADLLAQAQSRSLIQRDGAVQPISGRTDPNAPRRHLTSLDDAGAPPEIADSRTTTHIQQGAAVSDDSPLAAIPLRYRDLAARYFKRLAEQDRKRTDEEKPNHD